MPISIRCSQCGTTADYLERYAGCLRPCAKCGASVEVPENPKLVEQPNPIDPVCVCGSGQVDPESGMWYWLQYSEVHADRADRHRIAVFLHMIPILGLLMLQQSMKSEIVVRWSCFDCQRQVRRARWWSRAGYFACVVLLALGPWAALVALGMNEGWTRRDDWVGMLAIPCLLSPFVAYFAYRLGYRVLALRLMQGSAAFRNIGTLQPFKSPVYILPDGSHVGTLRDPPKGVDAIFPIESLCGLR